MLRCGGACFQKDDPWRNTWCPGAVDSLRRLQPLKQIDLFSSGFLGFPKASNGSVSQQDRGTGGIVSQQVVDISSSFGRQSGASSSSIFQQEMYTRGSKLEVDGFEGRVRLKNWKRKD